MCPNVPLLEEETSSVKLIKFFRAKLAGGVRLWGVEMEILRIALDSQHRLCSTCMKPCFTDDVPIVTPEAHV